MNNETSGIGELRQHLKDQIYALDQSAIVAITDSKGIITYVNKMFCDLSQYSTDELIGRTHSIINSGYHDKGFFKVMWQSIARGEVWRGEICNKAKDGTYYWVDTTIVPFDDDNGKIQQYIAIRYDITARKKAEAELITERQKLIESEKMASLGVLSAGIAHELGNPLGAIRGRLEMLETMCSQSDFQKEFAEQSIKKMIAQVDRMSKIIRGLKHSSRDGSHDEMQPFDLSQLVGDIFELSMQRCQKNNVMVEYTGFDEPVIIEGRETDIGQVIVNLFNNAFDAVKDHKPAWIRVRLTKEDEGIQIDFTDSGPGVPEDLIGKIFDPFFTTKDVGQGTGLGLSICRSFIESHKGSLSYCRESGKTCFCVKLPFKQS